MELRGFGAFSVKRRDARTARNPRTGETVSVSEKVIPVFKTGKEMRIRLNLKSCKEFFQKLIIFAYHKFILLSLSGRPLSLPKR